MKSRHTRDVDQEGLIDALLGDGRFLLAFTGVALAGSGGFAFFLCVTGQLLPHDVQALGFDAAQLRHAGGEHLVDFMFHDRAAFGGALIAIGSLYLWLVGFPLTHGERWAWNALAVSGGIGFASFLSYLGYGYLDTWHGVATLVLFPVFSAGLVRSRRLIVDPSTGTTRAGPWRVQKNSPSHRAGLWLLLAYGAGLVVAGITISILGMTRVFVATDLAFIGKSASEICGISSRLVPVIAHDRAGFGGGLISTGIIVVFVVWNAPLSRSLVQVLAVSGLAGFGGAIGVHYVIGYTNPMHVAPAWAGAALWAAGTILAQRAQRLTAEKNTTAAGPPTPVRPA